MREYTIMLDEVDGCAVFKLYLQKLYLQKTRTGGIQQFVSVRCVNHL